MKLERVFQNTTLNNVVYVDTRPPRAATLPNLHTLRRVSDRLYIAYR